MRAVSEAAVSREDEQRCIIIATAARLFREIGFQKTTVADIARALRMSPANVYRFFRAKSEINEAVARQLIGEIETAAEAIVTGPGTASDRLRALIKTNEQMNAERCLADRKLHEMVEVALDENWPIIDEHVMTLRGLIARLTKEGMANGEFKPGDPELSAGLVQAACIVYCHPRMMAECSDKPMPSSDQMLDFCLAALRA